MVRKRHADEQVKVTSTPMHLPYFMEMIPVTKKRVIHPDRWDTG
jgi:hypothetical protein